MALAERTRRELEPAIRFCQYNLSEQDEKAVAIELLSSSSAVLPASIEAMIMEERRKKTQLMETIEWGGTSIKIQNDQIRSKLIQIEQWKLEKQNDDDVFYDRILFALKDIEDLSIKVEPNVSDFISASIFKTKYARDMVLFQQQQEKNADEKSSIRMLDMALDDIQHLLPLFQHDPSQQAFWMARQQMLLAVRCAYQATCFVRASQRPEALALIQRAKHFYLAKVQDYLAFEMEEKEQLKKDLNVYRALIAQQSAQIYLSFSEKEENDEKAAEKEENEEEKAEKAIDLLSNNILGQFQNVPLAIFPPELDTMQPKPVLFDFALQTISPPDLSHRLEKKGWFSSFF